MLTTICATLALFAAGPGSPEGRLYSGAGSERARIAPTAPRTWHVIARAGELFTAMFDQSDADLAITLRDPDRKELGRFDFSQFGPEPVEFIAPSTGEFTLEVRALQTLRAPAEYAIKIEGRRNPDETDRRRIRGENLVASARLEYDKKTTESLQKAIADLREATGLLDQPADQRMAGCAQILLGDALMASSDTLSARESYGYAMALARETGDNRLLGEAFNKRGLAELNSGEAESADLSFGEALRIWKNVNFDYGAMIVLNNRALLKTRIGKWNDAFIDLQSLLNSPKLTDARLRAAAENNIGLTYEAVAAWIQAESHFKKAGALWESIPDDANQARALTNAARIRLLTNNPATALSAIQKAVALLRPLHDRQALAAALNVRAQVQTSSSQFVNSESDLREAISLYQSAGDRRGTASALYQLGLLQKRAGLLDEADGSLRESLALRQAVGLRDEQAITLHAMAMLARKRDREPEAATHLESAITLVETLRTSLAAPRYRITYAGERHKLYEELADLYAEEGRPDDSLRIVERGRSRQWLDDLWHGYAPKELSGQRQALETKLDFQLDRLVRYASLADSKTTKDLIRAVDGLIENCRDLDLQLDAAARKHPGFSEPRPLTPEQIRQMTPLSSAILYYEVGDERSHLFVVTRDDIKSYPLPGRSELTRLVTPLRKLLPAYRSRRSDPLAQRIVDRALARLSQILLTPAIPVIVRSRRLVVSASDVLQYVPFSALTVPEMRLPLGVKTEIVSVPSASVWEALRSGLQNRAPAPRSAVVFADPVFDDGDARVSSLPLAPAAILTLPRLLHANEEAIAIRRAARSNDAQIVTGFEANLDMLRSLDLAQFRFVHFATHAVINDLDPERSGITLSLVRPDGKARLGFVSGNDLSKLRLRSDVVVLSGCETAIGPFIRGEGIVSLVRPMFEAGTRAVLATLWPVEDEASAAFMKTFYESALAGASPAAALRVTQETMLHSVQWRDPAFWSGYVLLGDSR